MDKCGLLISFPDLGESHLLQAMGYEAVKQGFTVRGKSIFDLASEFRAADPATVWRGRVAAPEHD